MSYRHIFENSKDGNCPLCGSEPEEHRNNSRSSLNGWYCSNKNCEYSWDNHWAKLNKKEETSSDNYLTSESYEVETAKKEIISILIGAIIGAIILSIFISAQGGINNIYEVLACIWIGIGLGGNISLIPIFFRIGRKITESHSVGAGVICVILLWGCGCFLTGLILPLVRILLKIHKIKKIQGNEEEKTENVKKKRIITIAVVIAIIGIVVGYIAYNNQENSVTIPDGVTIIKEGEFIRKQLISVVIPDSVTSIGNNAFKQNKLTSIAIPGNVTSIGENAFAGNRLTDITIGSNVTIGPDAFGSRFETFYSNNGKTAGTYRRIDTKSTEWNVWHDNFKYQYNNGNISIIGFNSTGDDIVIPDEISGYPVTVIKSNAFNGKNLRNVTIPNNVTSIETNAFSSNNLTNITIPNSVTSIEINAFADNPITSVKIGAKVKLAEEPGANGAGVLGRRTGFNGTYANNGSRAGTYTRPNTNSTTWTRR